MKRVICCTLLVLCLLVQFAEAAGESRPRFTWNTMQFFWNKQALMGTEIKTAEKRGDTYFVAFGPTTGLTLRMEGDVVSEIEARFAYTGTPDVNGMAFLRLQESLIRVGTYRWPEEMRREVDELFREMSAQPRIYQARTSRFERRQEGSAVWVMTLRFVDGD